MALLICAVTAWRGRVELRGLPSAWAKDAFSGGKDRKPGGPPKPGLGVGRTSDSDDGSEFKSLDTHQMRGIQRQVDELIRQGRRPAITLSPALEIVLPSDERAARKSETLTR